MHAQAEDPRTNWRNTSSFGPGRVSTFEGLTLAGLANLLVKARILDIAATLGITITERAELDDRHVA